MGCESYSLRVKITASLQGLARVIVMSIKFESFVPTDPFTFNVYVVY